MRYGPGRIPRGRRKNRKRGIAVAAWLCLLHAGAFAVRSAAGFGAVLIAMPMLGDRVIRRVDPAKFGWLVGDLIFLSGVALLVK